MSLEAKVAAVAEPEANIKADLYVPRKWFVHRYRHVVFSFVFFIILFYFVHFYQWFLINHWSWSACGSFSLVLSAVSVGNGAWSGITHVLLKLSFFLAISYCFGAIFRGNCFGIRLAIWLDRSILDELHLVEWIGHMVMTSLPYSCASYFVCNSSATNRVIIAKDHASVQLNIGQLDAKGVYTGQFATVAFCGMFSNCIRGECDSYHARMTNECLASWLLAHPRHCFRQ